MKLIEAKEAVAFKYFREKWITLSLTEKVKHMDEVAELYADSKVKNLAQPDVIKSVCKSAWHKYDIIRLGSCAECKEDTIF